MAIKKKGQPRFCCDFHYLNAVTIKDAYPISCIDEGLSKLGDAKFFTTMNLGSAFWQVPLRNKDRERTGFANELGCPNDLVMESPQNGHIAQEFAGICQLLPRIHQRIRRQGVPNAAIKAQQREEVRIE